MPNPRVIPVQKTCPVCDGQFNVCPPGRSSRFYPKNSQVFCSRPCSYKGRYRSGTKCKTLSPVQAAYIAGFLDADGSIFMYQRRNKVAIRVAFSNNDLSVIAWIYEATGIGGVVDWHDGHENHAIRYQSQANGEAALTLLQQVEPFLVRKRKQASLAISHQLSLRDPSLSSDPSWQQVNYNLMMKLNSRGR